MIACDTNLTTNLALLSWRSQYSSSIISLHWGQGALHSNKQLLSSPDIRVNQAHRPLRRTDRAGWEAVLLGAQEGSKSKAKAEDRAGAREDRWKPLDKLALCKSMCRFSEMEGGNGSRLTFALKILELPS